MEFNKNTNLKVCFWGGRIISIIPFIIFLFTTIAISVAGSPDIKGMWIGALVGLIIAFFFSKNKLIYSEEVINGIGDKNGIIPVSCWIFAGLFAAILKASGIVSGIVWLASIVHASGTLFLLICFVSSAVFGAAAGTTFGTIIAGMTVLYPAGVFLGLHPGLLAGTIMGGAILGDNLAPVCDTTISASTSLDVDISLVVRTRAKFALIAGVMTVLGIILLNSRLGTKPLSSEILNNVMNPKGLIMLVPAFITLWIAIKKGNIIYATSVGSTLAFLFAFFAGLINLHSFFNLSGGSVHGILIDGVDGMVDICILALLIMACIHIFRAGGGDKFLLEMFSKFVKNELCVEFSNIILTGLLSAVTGLTAVSVLTVGLAFTKIFGEKYDISQKRSANIIAGTSVAIANSMPWTAGLLLMSALSIDVNKQFGASVPSLSAVQIFPWILFAWIHLSILILAIITGYDRVKESTIDAKYKSCKGNTIYNLIKKV
jgi:Na+/H+ antiporter NhaC